MEILEINSNIIEPVIGELSGNKYQWENNGSFIFFSNVFFQANLGLLYCQDNS